MYFFTLIHYTAYSNNWYNQCWRLLLNLSIQTEEHVWVSSTRKRNLPNQTASTIARLNIFVLLTVTPASRTLPIIMTIMRHWPNRFLFVTFLVILWWPYSGITNSHNRYGMFISSAPSLEWCGKGSTAQTTIFHVQNGWPPRCVARWDTI